MLSKIKLIFHLKEKWIFLTVLLLNIILLFSQRFIPSMDGPAHLYNSRILLSLLQNNSGILNNFFNLHSILIPNWLSHFLLAGFISFIPPWLAEKVLIILYISGLSLSFRILLKYLNPDNLAYSILIFPFIYSFLFHLGFYNYCLSFVFFFYTIFYWLKTRSSTRISNIIILLLLFTLTYYANILTFLFLGGFLGIIIVSEFLIIDKHTIGFANAIKKSFRSLILLFFVSLPGLVFLLFFYRQASFFSSEQRTPIIELIKWIDDVRPLIVYNYAYEEIFTEQILHILIVIIAISLYFRFKQKPVPKFSINDSFIIPAFFSLIMLFLIPSGRFAGMMSDRLALMFFMIMIVYIFAQKIPEKLKYFTIPLILIIHFSLLLYHYNSTLKKLNKDAIMITRTSSLIPEGCILLPIDMTENWLENHFSNYLGIDKDLVILDNYEASVDWFPVRWNAQKMPQILLGNQSSVSGISWRTNNKASNTRQIDYIFLYGQTKSIEKPEWQELNIILKDEYIHFYSSENEYIEIFKRK